MKIILCQFGEEIKVSEFINIIQAQIQASNIKASATNIIFKKYEEAKETEEGTAKENDNLNTVSFDTETQELIIYTGIKADEDTDNIKALLEEALKNEADTRTEKDAELKESIENEINYRETKDNELREAINNEATARAEKDSELENKILAIKNIDLKANQSDLTALQNKDIELENKINTEIQNRETKEKELESAINELKAEIEALKSS